MPTPQLNPATSRSCPVIDINYIAFLAISTFWAGTSIVIVILITELLWLELSFRIVITVI